MEGQSTEYPLRCQIPMASILIELGLSVSLPNMSKFFRVFGDYGCEIHDIVICVYVEVG